MRLHLVLWFVICTSTIITEAEAKKYWYCARITERLSVRCESCWTWIGGEAGRAACTIKYGGGVNTRYGKCDEDRNRWRCTR